MEQTTQEVLVNPYSQPHVLQQRMREEKLTHGEIVRADLSPVRLEHHPESGKTYMYFCPMHLIDVVEKVSPGDGGSLPAEATLKGIVIDKVLTPGLYTLKNVTLFSNGTLQVIANEDTKFEPFDEYLHAHESAMRYFEARTRQAQRQSHTYPNVNAFVQEVGLHR